MVYAVFGFLLNLVTDPLFFPTRSGDFVSFLQASRTVFFRFFKIKKEIIFKEKRMESLFMEAENARRPNFPSAPSNNRSNLYGGFGFKSSQNTYNYSLYPSVSQLLLLNPSNNMTVAPAPASFRFGSIPATYTSLPPIPLHHQPPLLPLPMKSATMPSSTKKFTTPPSAISRSSSTSARQSNQKRKKKLQQLPKPSASPKKEAAAGTAKIEEAPKPMESNPTIMAAVKKEEEEEEETEEEFLFGSATASKETESSVYSLSPPPSSLPLPRLLLMKLRRSARVEPVASSCIAEARAGVDAGATDDLRKLLRF